MRKVRPTPPDITVHMLRYYGEDCPPPPKLEMTPKEESALFRRMKRDPAAKEKLVRRYLCWAFKIATKMKGPRLDFDEAIAVANMGLMEALESYDQKKGRFTTHSFFVIRRHLIIALVNTYPVHVSDHSRKKIKELEAVEAKRILAGGEPPENVDTFFDRLGETTDFDVASLYDRPEDSPFVPAPSEGPDDCFLRVSNAADVRRAIDTLLTRVEKATVVGRHYSDPPLTFKRIGAKMGVGRNGVSDAYQSALQKLKGHFVNGNS